MIRLMIIKQAVKVKEHVQIQTLIMMNQAVLQMEQQVYVMILSGQIRQLAKEKGYALILQMIIMNQHVMQME